MHESRRAIIHHYRQHNIDHPTTNANHLITNDIEHSIMNNVDILINNVDHPINNANHLINNIDHPITKANHLITNNAEHPIINNIDHLIIEANLLISNIIIGSSNHCMKQAWQPRHLKFK